MTRARRATTRCNPGPELPVQLEYGLCHNGQRGQQYSVGNFRCAAVVGIVLCRAVRYTMQHERNQQVTTPRVLMTAHAAARIGENRFSMNRVGAGDLRLHPLRQLVAPQRHA